MSYSQSVWEHKELIPVLFPAWQLGALKYCGFSRCQTIKLDKSGEYLKMPTLEVAGAPQQSDPTPRKAPKMAAEPSTAALRRENTLGGKSRGEIKNHPNTHKNKWRRCRQSPYTDWLFNIPHWRVNEVVCVELTEPGRLRHAPNSSSALPVAVNSVWPRNIHRRKHRSTSWKILTPKSVLGK